MRLRFLTTPDRFSHLAGAATDKSRLVCAMTSPWACVACMQMPHSVYPEIKICPFKTDWPGCIFAAPCVTTQDNT